MLLLFLFVTLGSAIWPYPQTLSEGNTIVSISPRTFVIEAAAGSSTPLLEGAITRYTELVFPLLKSASYQDAPGNHKVLTRLVVTLVDNSPAPELVLGVDESYDLSVGSDGQATLRAQTVWGAMHGLETFSQLIVVDLRTMTYTIPTTPVVIHDFPRFQWRGLLMDTSRHFLDPEVLFRTVNALSYNKMNVLHWHAIDAHSFPIEIKAYPDLAGKGAYDPEYAIYSQEFISDVVKYGYERGVRIVPEFDMPGHAKSWGAGFPSVLAQCPPNKGSEINNWPLNPSQELTYQLVEAVVNEMTALFDDHFFHVGGDEVEFECWFRDPTIQAWMLSNGYQTGQQIYSHFEERLSSMVSAKNKTMVVWQEVFLNGVSIPSDAVVHVWYGNHIPGVVNAGRRCVSSQGWYLDVQLPKGDASKHYLWADTWMDFYNVEPWAGVSESARPLVLGGEAAMWGETIDFTVFDERVWPKASATGERLWSAMSKNNVSEAKPRLIKFRCHTARRGIHGGPINPDYCAVNL